MEEKECAIDDLIKILEVFGKKHMLIVLQQFHEKNPLRFNEIMKNMRISPKTLSDRLKELQKLGILKRFPKAEIPPRVDYALTKKGHELKAVFEPISKWATKYHSS